MWSFYYCAEEVSAALLERVTHFIRSFGKGFPPLPNLPPTEVGTSRFPNPPQFKSHPYSWVLKTALDRATFSTRGRGEIWTHDTLAGMPLFESGAFNHSATLPFLIRENYISWRILCQFCARRIFNGFLEAYAVLLPRFVGVHLVCSWSWVSPPLHRLFL